MEKDAKKCVTENLCKLSKFLNKNTKKCVNDCKADFYYRDDQIKECLSKCSGTQYQYKDDTTMTCVENCSAYPSRYRDDIDKSVLITVLRVSIS